MKPERSDQAEVGNSSSDLGHVLEEIERAIRGVNYGSVEVIIQNSRVVQIERKEKFSLRRKLKPQPAGDRQPAGRRPDNRRRGDKKNKAN